jgi:hypothetical protein
MTSQYRHRRTSVATTAFTNPLEPGEIAVNTANRQLAVGDANGGSIGAPLALLPVRYFDVRAQYAASDMVVQGGIIYRAKALVPPGAFVVAQWDAVAGDVNPIYLLKAGDTMTGALVLAADPTVPLGAATKQYSDAKLAKAGGTMTGALVLAADPATPLQAATKQYADTMLPLSGGSITGTLTVNGNFSAGANVTLAHDPALPLEAATKGYVDGLIAARAVIYVSDTPPAGAPANSLWWESDTGLLFVRYNDGDSTQWVLSTPQPDTSAFLATTGGTMSGALVLGADPAVPLGAATKQYVDASALKVAGGQTITGGFAVTPNNLGALANFTLNPLLGNYQYGTNNAAFTLTAPTVDCAVDILVTNGASAGAITFSGFTVGASIGDALTTTNAQKFIISIRRINATSTYTIKALQ